MIEVCNHDWSEAIDTCRICEGTELGLMEIVSEPSIPGFFRVKTEPLYGDYCFQCDDFTMVSEAFHCQKCSDVEWLETMDEAILGS